MVSSDDVVRNHEMLGGVDPRVEEQLARAHDELRPYNEHQIVAIFLFFVADDLPEEERSVISGCLKTLLKRWAKSDKDAAKYIPVIRQVYKLKRDQSPYGATLKELIERVCAIGSAAIRPVLAKIEASRSDEERAPSTTQPCRQFPQFVDEIEDECFDLSTADD